MHSNKNTTDEKVIHISKYTIGVHQGGGKAEGLKRIVDCALRVPETWVLLDADSALLDQDTSQLETLHETIESFAVRSSAVGEDGLQHSFAGMFTTVLDVPRHELHSAVREVVGSLSSSQTIGYQMLREQSISKMCVVIQEMINSDYAGVLFTELPTEHSSGVMLIEVVRGIGEQLVSGKVTPLSIRYNSVTGMSRVLQAGAQNITTDDCWFLEELISGAQTLRKHIGHELDIEWCVKDGALYFLQARPITA